jgi:cell division protein FtsQ
MTTLDVDVGALRRAVARYRVVRDLQVSTQFPHGIRIRVIEEPPVAEIVAGARTTAVAADGTVLPSSPTTSQLPTIDARVPQGGGRLTDPAARRLLGLLGAAPYQMLSQVSQVTAMQAHGLVAQIRGGPSIYFGQPTRLIAKWIAVSEVLADPGSAGATYIDVTDPERPAAGAPGASASTSTGSSPSTSG